MAKKLGVSESIVSAKSTDGLWEDDRTDEDQLGATYPELEWAMEFKNDPEELVGRAKEIYYIYHTPNVIPRAR